MLIDYTNTGYDRKSLYLVAWDLTPDEIVGATELDCELDLRGITANGTYALKDYCSNPNVDRCSNCSLCNYGFDCHNNKVAQ